MNWEHWERTGNTLGDKNNPIFQGYLLIPSNSVTSVPSFFTPYLSCRSPAPQRPRLRGGGKFERTTAYPF